jgi:hypothetical protein
MTRRVIVLLAASLVLGTATAALAAGSALRTVHRGQLAALTLATPSHGSCLAVITYQDGTQQNSSTVSPMLGKVTWHIRVPRRAALGVASWLARCGVLWEKTGSWRVARA